MHFELGAMGCGGCWIFGWTACYVAEDPRKCDLARVHSVGREPKPKGWGRRAWVMFTIYENSIRCLIFDGTMHGRWYTIDLGIAR
jgi:hypothetical protein